MKKNHISLKSLIASALAFSMLISFAPSTITAKAIDTSSSITITKLTSEDEQGTMLHAWDWSFNTVKANVAKIKAAGYSAVQVSPVEPSKDDSAITNSKWYLLYQPIAFRVGNVQLGTEEEFKAMCDAAHNEGLKIIVDVVTNHTGNNEGDGSTTIAPQVTFQGSGYEYYWHLPLHGVKDWNDRYEVTHGGLGLPDLNTSNADVQNMIRTFLEECLTDGADGFRFDTAKHIELPSPLDDDKTSSNYWPNVLSGLKTYNNKTPFVYGEVLQGGADNFANYTKLMDITASNFGGAIRSIVGVGSNASSNLSDANFNNYKSYNIPSDVDPSSLVTWVESHDTYANDSEESTALTAEQIRNGWALTASRAASTPLFFNRTAGRSKLQGNIGDEGDSNWKNPDVVAVNKFHNAMVGESENVTKLSDKIVMIQRGNKGIVVVNLGSEITNFSTAATLKAGNYTNCATAGGAFTASGTQLTGDLKSGITVLYEGGIPETPVYLPEVSADKENCTFYDPFQLTLHVKNTATGTYTINGGTETTYSDGDQVAIGATATAGEKIKVALKARNSDGEATEEYNYIKKDVNSVATVYFKKPAGWTIPYVYIYNEYNEKNASFPGIKMTKIGSDFYKYELTGWADAKVQFNDNYNGHKTSTFDLATNGNMVYDGGVWKGYDHSYDSLIDPNVTPDQEEQETSKVYFKNTQNWPDVNVYFYTNVGGFKEVNGGWPGIAMNNEGNGLFSYTLPKAFEGAQILFNTTGGNTQIPASGGFLAPANSTMICEPIGETQDATWKEYVEAGTSKIYFRKPSDWAEPKIYAYAIDGNSDSKVSGAVAAWPGVSMTKVDGTETLYTYTFSSDCQNINVIFNDGNNQFPSSGGYKLLAGESKIYDNGSLRDFTTDDLEEPEAPAIAGQGVTKVLFKNTENWSNVKIYYWQDGSPSVAWPGVSMVNEGDNLYSYNLPKGYEKAKVIFNNGNGKQTVDLSTKVGNTMEFVSSGESDGKLTGELISKSKVYFKNTKGWKSVKIHYWQDGGSSTDWPGVSMVDEGDNLYSYTMPDGFENANVIFNNNGKGEQTETFKAEDGKTLILSEDTWREFTEDDIPGAGTGTDPEEPTNPGDNVETGSTVYVKVPEGWAGIPNIHYWNTAGGTTTWPGKQMKNEGSGVYSAIIPKSFGDVTIIINDGSSKLSDKEGKNEFDVKLGSSIIFENGEWKDYVKPTPNPGGTDNPDDGTTHQDVSKTPTVEGTIYTKTKKLSGTAGANADIVLSVEEEVKYTTSAGAQVITQTKTEEKEIGRTKVNEKGNWTVNIPSQSKGTIIKVTEKEEGKLEASVEVTVRKKSSSNSSSSSSSSNQETVTTNGSITTVRSSDGTIIKNQILNSTAPIIKVNLSSDSTVGKAIFEALAGNQNKKLTLVGNNATWTFNGADILVNNVADLEIAINSTSPNALLINNLTGGSEVITLSFAHKGLLPGKATIQTNVDSKYNNKTMYLYSYNLANNRLNLISVNVPVINGIATFNITKGSDYVLSETPVPGAVSEGWNKIANGNWIFVKEENNVTGWIKEGANWYLTDNSGVMKRGWANSNGKWYYLNSAGAMQTGWINDNGTWYYLSPLGDMLFNTSIDGYTLGDNGALVK